MTEYLMVGEEDVHLLSATAIMALISHFRVFVMFPPFLAVTTQILMSRSYSADPVVPADFVEDHYSPTISNVAGINGPEPPFSNSRIT